MAELLEAATGTSAQEITPAFVVPEACLGIYACRGAFDPSGTWICLDPVHAQVDYADYTGNY